jgi:hypothetical protein
VCDLDVLEDPSKLSVIRKDVALVRVRPTLGSVLQPYLHLDTLLTNTRRSDDVPESDGVLRVVDREKILHYHQLYINCPDPIVFLPVTVDTTGRIYDDFCRLLFLYHPNREASVLVNEIPEESDEFRFLRDSSYTNIKGSMGLIWRKMWS